jgi:mutator protein MutT
MTDRPPNAASVALVRDGRVLLIARACPSFAGYWTLPGGRIEPGETAEAAAAREVFEEMGIAVAHPMALMRMDATPEWRLGVFVATEFSGSVVPSDEIAQWRWVAPEQATTMKVTPGLGAVLAAALRAVPPFH